MLAQPPIWLIVLAFIAAISPLVFFHELGHYLVARLFGVGAETFSIGFGQEIVGWTDKRGTRWKVGWLPLGGYVRFIGDMNAASAPGDVEELPPELRERSFPVKPVWQRFLIVLAGPAANYLLAVLIYATVFSVITAPTANRVGYVEPNTAAASAGLRYGDRILAVAGKQTGSFDDVRSIVEQNPNRVVDIDLERNGNRQQLKLRLGAEKAQDETGRIIAIGHLGAGAAPVGVGEALPLAVVQTVQITGEMVGGFAQIFSGQASRQEFGGPLRIAEFAGQAASLGLLPFLGLLALLSINLGFINLLPVPMLDGGHLFFYILEAARRRPVSTSLQEWAFRGGLMLLLVLLVFVTVNDLGSFGLWDRLGRLIG
jgi:regulator of sigma E protease